MAKPNGKAPPNIANRRFVNDRTGEVVNVPQGIDPGFDYNPGMARQKNIDEFLAGKFEKAHPDLARVAALDLVSSSKYRASFNKDDRSLTAIATINNDMKKHINADSVILYGHGPKQLKIRDKHKMPHEMFRNLNTIINEGEVKYVKNGINIRMFIEGKPYLVGIRKNYINNRSYLSTFFEIRKKGYWESIIDVRNKK